MEKLVFSIVIDAPREKVWDVLWGTETYPKWTSAFGEGSNVRTDWKQGSKAIFTDESGMGGMVSEIAERRDNEYMGIRHLGMLKDGKEDLDSDEVKEWAGARENYTLNAKDGKTELVMDMDINQKFADMFRDIWPKALDNVKQLAEA